MRLLMLSTAPLSWYGTNVWYRAPYAKVAFIHVHVRLSMYCYVHLLLQRMDLLHVRWVNDLVVGEQQLETRSRRRKRTCGALEFNGRDGRRQPGAAAGGRCYAQS